MTEWSSFLGVNRSTLSVGQSGWAPNKPRRVVACGPAFSRRYGTDQRRPAASDVSARYRRRQTWHTPSASKTSAPADCWLWTRTSSGRTKPKNGESDHTLCTLRQMPLTLSSTRSASSQHVAPKPLTRVRRRLQVYVTPYDAGITSAATDSVMVTCTVCPGFSWRRNFCISGVFASTM